MTPVLFMHDLQNQNELVQRSIASERCLFLPGFPSYVSHGGSRYSRSAKLPQQTFSCKLSPLIPSFFPVCIKNFSVCVHSYFCSAFLLTIYLHRVIFMGATGYASRTGLRRGISEQPSNGEVAGVLMPL